MVVSTKKKTEFCVLLGFMIAGQLQKASRNVDAIARYERHLGIRKKIDLLTISHFDADHISGVGELIRKFKIGTLLLPYTDLKQRLIFAFEHGVDPNSNLMDFYINPTAYLTRLEGPGIDRILVVRSGGGDGPNMPEGNPDVPGDGDFPELKFEIERGEDSKEMAGDAVARPATHAGWKLRAWNTCAAVQNSNCLICEGICPLQRGACRRYQQEV